MERTQVLDMMGTLKLYGMRSAYDEVMATGIKRQHEPPKIVGDLLSAEIAEKQARSIKYQLTVAKLPLAKDLDDFQFEGTPINQTLVNDLAGGGFIAQQRNVVLVGGTGTGKTHLAIAIARSCIRSGARGRFYNVVDPTNSRWLYNESRPRRTRLSPIRPIRRTTSVPSRQPALRAHLHRRHHQSRLRRMAQRVRRRQDDHRAARSSDPPLRHRRNRQRQLALQKPRR